MNNTPVVLGFRPNSHGFAWIAFSSPFAIHDWGVVEARGEKNARCVAQVEKLLTRLSPHTFVLEAYEGKGASACPRVVRLCRAVVALARDQGIEVTVFTRNEVQACFAAVGARSRYEIAATVARSFALLREMLPAPRRPWDSSHRRMALFEAAAVVLTHYHLGASQLFENLKSTEEGPTNE